MAALGYAARRRTFLTGGAATAGNSSCASVKWLDRARCINDGGSPVRALRPGRMPRGTPSVAARRLASGAEAGCSCGRGWGRRRVSATATSGRRDHRAPDGRGLRPDHPQFEYLGTDDDAPPISSARRRSTLVATAATLSRTSCATGAAPPVFVDAGMALARATGGRRDGSWSSFSTKLRRTTVGLRAILAAYRGLLAQLQQWQVVFVTGPASGSTPPHIPTRTFAPRRWRPRRVAQSVTALETFDRPCGGRSSGSNGAARSEAGLSIGSASFANVAPPRIGNTLHGQ